MSAATLVALAAAGTLSGPALAAPCPAGPDREQYTVWLRDLSVSGSDVTPIGEFKGPLPLLHAFEVSITGVDDVQLEPPAGVPFRRDGRSLIVAPRVAGQLPIAATWNERFGASTCEGSTTITLPIAPLTERPRVSFRRFSASDRPLVEFTVHVARGPLAQAGRLTIRTRIGTRAVAPRGRPRALFTLPLAPPAFDVRPPSSGLLARRSARRRGVVIRGLSAFDPDNFEQIEMPIGGTAAQLSLSFDGSGRRSGGFYRLGVLARRGLVVQVVQNGRVLGRLATGIRCVNTGRTVPRCRTPGYRTST